MSAERPQPRLQKSDSRRLSLESAALTGLGAFVTGTGALILHRTFDSAWPSGLFILASAVGISALGRRRVMRELEGVERVALLTDELTRGAPLDAARRDQLDSLGVAGTAIRTLFEQLTSLAAGVMRIVRRVETLPDRLNAAIRDIANSADAQEEAVEETASLLANINSSMKNITERIGKLERSADESASSILEMGSSVDEVARNAASLHESVESSTSSVHEMGASIRQVADSAGEVERIAEETAASMLEMDRVVQEITPNASVASELTPKVSEGAERGGGAVADTIQDIKEIHARTDQARDGLSKLVSRISEIDGILGVIGEINDETNLLSLNAAIIAAQAGEQGKAFLVVANHVKTLARRTAASTKDIEKLITDVQSESVAAVSSMNAGIEAIETGVSRSKMAGDALAEIRESAQLANDRVLGIARATDEQARSSKLVARAAQDTSGQIRQISMAMSEQSSVSDTMLQSSEAALELCRHVHRSTDEQRETGRYITDSISSITDMIREIREDLGTHSRASDSVSESVMNLLENAQKSAACVPEVASLLVELRDGAAEIIEQLGQFDRESESAGSDGGDPNAADRIMGEDLAPLEPVI